jgi:biotin-(acetyl-CoA carboxylase) ligase
VREALCGTLGGRALAPDEAILAAFRERDALAGRQVSWDGDGAEPGSGVARGVDDRGNLVVELEGGGRRSLGSGEVGLRLPPASPPAAARTRSGSRTS